MVCARCGHTNPTGSKFCNQCGLEQRAWDVALVAYTPPHLAAKIRASRAAIEGERKHVTVLFLDIRRSMDLARLTGDEEWHRLLDRFFTILAEEVHRFEGTVNQYTGDGIMALFGAPLAHEDHARRACHAALALRQRLRPFAADVRRRHGARFAVRMGLNSGEVVVGTIGDDLRMDYTALGHTVGLAARMERAAGADRILLSEHTASQVSGYFELEDAGAARVKGAAGPVRRFVLRAAGRAQTRIDAAGARGLGNFLGREREMAVLRTALEKAVAGYGQVVGVVGEAGVGKSRLCREFAAACRADELAVIEVHCPSHARSIPWFAAVEMLRGSFGIAAGDDRRTASRRIDRQLRRLGRGFLADRALVYEALGLPLPRGAAAVAEARGERLGAFLQRLLQTESARAPLAVVVDDAHWLDSESDALLKALADAVGWTRTLLLLNFRPEYRPPWEGLSYASRLEVSPLAGAESDALLVSLLGAGADSAELRGLIRERAGGNPFFLEEIVQSLVEDGSLRRAAGDGSGFVLPANGAPAALAVPPTVQALIAARIDRLPEVAKVTLQTAAVAGKTFSRALLQRTLEELGGAPPIALDGALAELRAGDFLRDEAGGADGDLVFRHPLTRDVAYQTQLRDRRCQVHAAVARALESLHAERLGTHAALIAHHWDAADRRHEASVWRYRAALNVTGIQVRRAREKG